MGNKDKTRDENAATSSDREQESRDTALARTIALAVAEAFAKQKAEETKLITKPSQGKWRRLRRNMMSF